MLGENALAIYLLSSLVARLLEVCQVTAGDSASRCACSSTSTFSRRGPSAENGSLGFALAYLLVWMVPTAELHRRRVFFRV